MERAGWRALGGERWDLQASHVLTLVVQQSRIVDPVTSSITRQHVFSATKVPQTHQQREPDSGDEFMFIRTRSQINPLSHV